MGWTYLFFSHHPGVWGGCAAVSGRTDRRSFLSLPTYVLGQGCEGVRGPQYADDRQAAVLSSYWRPLSVLSMTVRLRDDQQGDGQAADFFSCNFLP